MSRNAYRSIIDFTSAITDVYPTESSRIYVESAYNRECPDATVFLSLLRPGANQVAYAYLTDHEVTDLIDALNYWRNH